MEDTAISNSVVKIGQNTTSEAKSDSRTEGKEIQRLFNVDHDSRTLSHRSLQMK